jgi:hypothetical protein
LNFREFFELLRKSKQSQEKVETNGTGFSAEFFGSQLVEMFCFARKTKLKCWQLLARA